MKPLLKRILALISVIVLICTIFAGCSSTTTNIVDKNLLKNFKADIFDIAVGESETVKFTVEVADENINSVDLCYGEKSVIGKMTDDGKNGDNISGDNIFTCVTELAEKKRANIDYFAVSGENTSNTFRIAFYSPITAEEYQKISTFSRSIDDIKTLEEAEDYIKNSNDVESYKVDKDGKSINYKTKYGVSGAWTIFDSERKGTPTDISTAVIPDNDKNYSGVLKSVEAAGVGTYSSKKGVLVIRPFRHDGFDYDDFLYAGMAMGKASNGKVDVYDDANADIDVFKNFGNYGNVLVDSHGYLDYQTNETAIVTGEELSEKNSRYYSADLNSERIILINSKLCVKADFFNKYYPTNSLNDTAVFLGTCYSAYNNSFGDTLTGKGSPIVLGYSDAVFVDYCNETLYHFMIKKMTLAAAEASDAFNSTVKICGAADSGGAKFVMFKKGDDIHLFSNEYANNDSNITTFSTAANMEIRLGNVDVIEPEIKASETTDYNIYWTSSNTDVATVNNEGNVAIVNAVGVGNATIKATLVTGGQTITSTTDVKVSTVERDVVLVLDMSSSMEGTPFYEMQEVAHTFCDDILSSNAENRVAIVTYNSEINSIDFTSDVGELSNFVNEMYATSRTDIYDALVEAETIMDNEARNDAVKNIIIMSDGAPNEGATSTSGSFERYWQGSSSFYLENANAVVDKAEELMKNYNVYSLGFFHSLYGEEYDYCSTLMSLLSNQTDGFYEVTDAENLSFAFGDIGETITDGSKIIINIACPVDVTVSCNGETLSSKNGDGEADFGKVTLLGKNKDIKLFSLDSDNTYDIDFAGTGDGKMDYSINYYDSDNNMYDFRNFMNVPLSKTTKMVSDTDNSNPVELSIDSDGDGNYDDVWQAGTYGYGSSLTQKKAEVTVTESADFDKTAIIIISIVGVVVLALVIVMILVTVNKSKNQVKLQQAAAGGTPQTGRPVSSTLPPVRSQALNLAIDNSKPKNYNLSRSINIALPNGRNVSYPAVNGKVYRVGKDSSWADIIIPKELTRLSRQHCTIVYNQETDSFIVDDMSSNGVYYSDGTRLKKGKNKVKYGATIVLGKEDVSIKLK